MIKVQVPREIVAKAYRVSASIQFPKQGVSTANALSSLAVGHAPDQPVYQTLSGG